MQFVLDLLVAPADLARMPCFSHFQVLHFGLLGFYAQIYICLYFPPNLRPLSMGGLLSIHLYLRSAIMSISNIFVGFLFRFSTFQLACGKSIRSWQS